MLLLLLLSIRASLGPRQEEESVTASGKVEVFFCVCVFLCVFCVFFDVMFVFNVMLGWWVVVMVEALPRWLGP